MSAGQGYVLPSSSSLPGTNTAECKGQVGLGWAGLGLAAAMEICPVPSGLVLQELKTRDQRPEEAKSSGSASQKNNNSFALTKNKSELEGLPLRLK